MNAIDQLNKTGDFWGEAVSSVLVQSVFVFAIAMTVTWLLRNYSATLRFWVWHVAALKLLIVPFSMVVVLPFWPPTPVPEAVTAQTKLVTSSRDTQDVVIESEIAPLAKPLPRFEEQPTRLSPAAGMFLCWALVFTIQIARHLRRKHRLKNFLSDCVPAVESDGRRLQTLSTKLNLKQTVRLVRGDVQVPLVTGLLSPTVILPLGVEFDEDTFDQVVLHELAHVKRRDLLWVWLPETLRMFFFFHPLVYWIQQQAKLYSEMACDELVLSVGASRRNYAKTLLELATPKGNQSREAIAGSCV